MFCVPVLVFSQKIHVIVALCDNQNQGIAPVNSMLGNGQNASSNLYWGARYGFKTWFKNSDWTLIEEIKNPSPYVLERVSFIKNGSEMMAEAYDGAYIKNAIEDFITECYSDQYDLVVYLGHNGLMEFELKPELIPSPRPPDVVIISCLSKPYFEPLIKPSGANPLVWTSAVVAPESYTLDYILNAWLLKKSNEEILQSAITGYCKYQKCDVSIGKTIFVTGYD